MKLSGFIRVHLWVRIIPLLEPKIADHIADHILEIIHGSLSCVGPATRVIAQVILDKNRMI